MPKRPKLSRKEILEHAVCLFAKQAGRKAQKGSDPNDRRYDNDFQRSLRRMPSEELNELLNGED